MMPRSSERGRRRGVALVAVIAVLILLIAVGAVLMRLGSMERRQVAAEERRIAASWLAESGLERAFARLEADRNYPGETWRIAPEELGGKDGGEVVIAVETPAGEPDRRTIRVRANTPPDGVRRVRQSRVLSLLLNTKSPLPGANP